MHVSSRGHTTFAALLCLALIPFVRLGDGDLGVGESLNVLRAQHASPALLAAQIDQRAPAPSWVMSPVISLLGFSNFSARLPFALCFAVLIIAVYLLARRVAMPRLALGAAGFLATSVLLVHAAQVADGLILAMALLYAALAALVYARDLGNRVLALVGGALLGASEAAVPAVFMFGAMVTIGWIATDVRRGADARQRWVAIAFGAGAVLVGVPLFAVSGAAAGAGGVLGTAMDILADMPIIVLVLIYAVRYVTLRGSGRKDGHGSIVGLLGVLWGLAVGMEIVVRTLTAGSFAQPGFMLMLALPALAILSVVVLDALLDASVPAVWRAASIAAVFLAAGWTVGGSAGLMVASFAITAIFIASLRTPTVLSAVMWRIPTVGLVMMIALRLVSAAFGAPSSPASGARTVVQAIPRIGSVLFLGDTVIESAPFLCYDASKTLSKRVIFADQTVFAARPGVIPDSIHSVILKATDRAQGDHAAVQATENLRVQQFVRLLHTAQYDLYSRGLLRDQ